jgi:hypothetical protein
MNLTELENPREQLRDFAAAADNRKPLANAKKYTEL